MKKYLILILILFCFCLSYIVFADEVSQKTDSSFVGDNPPKPINSSFIGDISNSMVDETSGKEDVSKQTDSSFVGEDTESGNSSFAGDNFDRAVNEDTDKPFAGDSTFAGKNYGK